MNSTFEDRLLAELKIEMAARQPQARTATARWTTSRKLVALGGVVGVAAAAAIAVPVLTGSTPPAYAVTKNPDGSITLKIHDFRDPEGVERELAAHGVNADVSYMPLGKRCAPGRYRPLPGDQISFPKELLKSTDPEDPAVQAKVQKWMMTLPSRKAIRSRDGITIYPEYIERGQTAVLEIAENPKEPTAENPGIVWSFNGRLTDGPVKPCRLVDEPGAFGDATPPPGAS